MVTRFAHQRLDAYHLALELFSGVEALAARLPRGHSELKDQLRRAVGATVRNIAEGANRVHPRDKAARFIVARAECGECEGSLEMVEVLRLGCARHLRMMADRVGAMLWGLIKRERARAGIGALRAPP